MEDPESRVPCENCGLLIRKVDAKYQNDRCHPCDRMFREKRVEKSKSEFRKNPPQSQEEIMELMPGLYDFESLWIGPFLTSIRPPLVDPKNFTERKFSGQLGGILSKYRDNPKAFESEFIHLCDFIATSGSGLFEGIMKIPSPYNSIYAVIIARGNIQLGDFSQALANIDPKLDREIDRGLQFLGCDSSCGLIKSARANLLSRFVGLSEKRDRAFCGKFLAGLRGDKFIEEVLLPFIATRLEGEIT